MKVLFGKKLNINFSYRIKEYLFWPAFEFVVPIKGYNDYDKNILEYTILQLININIIEENEIASAMGLETDLVSFVKSRLFQKDLIDSADKITDKGKELLKDDQKKNNDGTEDQTYINIYVDAVTGDIIPYIKHIHDDNNLQNITAPFAEKDEDGNFTGFYKFNMSQSIGKDSDEELKAWKIQDNSKYNQIPQLHLINETLNRMNIYEMSMRYNKNELADEIHNIYVPFSYQDEKTLGEKVFFLLELFLPEGKSGPGDWTLSNGFGHFSNFFSNRLNKYISQKDQSHINGLRSQLSNAFIGKENSKNNKENNRYPNLVEKIEELQKCMSVIKQKIDSPDAEENYKDAKNQAILLVTQIIEWTFWYTLKNYEFNVTDVFCETSYMQKNKYSQHRVYPQILRLLSNFDLNMDKKTKMFINQSFDRIKSSYITPSLCPLFDLVILALRKETFFKDFVKKNKNFLLDLQNLNELRNNTFHTNDDISKQEEIEYFYDLAKKIMKAFLNIEVKNEQGNNIFFEIITKFISRDEAVMRVEQKLGFLLCKSLDYSLINCFVNIEKNIKDNEQIINNKIILDLYIIYEKIFVLMNLCFSDDYKNKDWLQKAKSAGFSLNTDKIEAVTKTKRLEDALNRKKTTMQAACAAFLALSNIQLLKDIKNECSWITFVEDISLIAHLRGHGEIPLEIDTEQILFIREKTYAFVKLLTQRDFLINYI